MSAIWVIVADTSKARFFSADKPAGDLIEIKDLTNPEARLHEGDLVSDTSGRDRSMSSGGHSVGNKDEHKQEGAARFAAEVCSNVEASRTAGEFNRLYVIAAPAFLGLMRKHRSSSTAKMLAMEIDKNLSAMDTKSIRKHLPDYL